MAGTIKITDDNFESEILNASQPALVDFYADWCGPCRQLAPIVEELAEEYDGKLVVGKLNVDDNMDTAAKFKVRSIPTLVLIKDGKAAETLVGVQDKGKLKEKIDALIG